MPFDPDAYLKATEDRAPRARTAPAPETPPDEPKTTEGKTEPPGESTTKAFTRGVAQGAVGDPLEGIGQFAEWALGRKIPMPKAVRNWLREQRDKTEQTTAGRVGRLTGTVGSLALAPEAALAAKAASIGYRAARMTGPELVALSNRLGRAETLNRIDRYAKAVGKPGNKLSNNEIAEALLGSVPGKARATLSPLARVATGAGTAVTRPVEGASPEDYLEEKGYQALTGGALGGLAGSGIAKGAGKFLRPHYLPFHGLGGYGLHALGLGPWGIGAGAGTLATLAALAKGGGARSVSGLGGLAGEAVRTLEEPEHAETD